MRVVAGSARGRPLVAPPGDDVRPTTDRVREAVLNSLHSLGAVEGAVVLDLFAGSGALGVEALSRGAASATFVDRSPAALGAVRTNLERCGLAGRAHLVRAEAQQHLRRTAGSATPPTLVFCDPPYAFDGWDDLLAALAPAAPGAVVLAESDREVAAPGGAEVLRCRRHGGTVVTTIRLPGAAQGDIPGPPDPSSGPHPSEDPT